MSSEANILDRLNTSIDSSSGSGGLSLFDSEGRKKSQSALLIEIGQQALLFHDSGGVAYADVNTA